MNAIRSQIRSMLKTEPSDGGYRAIFTLSPDLSILPDHFSYSPLLPGICIVQAVLLSGAMAIDALDLQMISLKNAKLLQPILPGDTVTIDADMAAGLDGQFTIKARFTGDGKRRAEISLIAKPVYEPQAVAL